MNRRIKKHLVSDRKKPWRWYSIIAMGLALSIQLTWLELPDEMKKSLPPGFLPKATMLVVALGIVGRFIKQFPEDSEKDDAGKER